MQSKLGAKNPATGAKKLCAICQGFGAYCLCSLYGPRDGLFPVSNTPEQLVQYSALSQLLDRANCLHLQCARDSRCVCLTERNPMKRLKSVGYLNLALILLLPGLAEATKTIQAKRAIRTLELQPTPETEVVLSRSS